MFFFLNFSSGKGSLYFWIVTVTGLESYAFFCALWLLNLQFKCFIQCLFSFTVSIEGSGAFSSPQASKYLPNNTTHVLFKIFSRFCLIEFDNIMTHTIHISLAWYSMSFWLLRLFGLIEFEKVPTIIGSSISYTVLYYCLSSSFLPKACYNFWDCSSLEMFYFFYYVFIFILLSLYLRQFLMNLFCLMHRSSVSVSP